jgi:hypothetical protein
VPPSSLAAKTSPAALSGRLFRWSAVLALALLAGVAAWLIGERTFQYAKLSKAASENYQNTSLLNAEMPDVLKVNGALTFGVLGAALGLAMGLAGSLCGLPRAHPIAGAFVGLLLGAAAGALPSVVIMPWYWRHRHDDPATVSLLVPLLIHLGLWSGAGLAAGLAFGIGRGQARPASLVQMTIAGLLGAMIGTAIFELAGAFLFPFDFTADPFSITPGSRLLARLCVSVFVGVAVIKALPQRSIQKGDLELV